MMRAIEEHLIQESIEALELFLRAGEPRQVMAFHIGNNGSVKMNISQFLLSVTPRQYKAMHRRKA